MDTTNANLLQKIENVINTPSNIKLVPKETILKTKAPSGFEGEGFPVKRAFAGVPLHMLDPFIHMDQMGAVEYSPGEPRGTNWHPHKGFETFTYLMNGEFIHQDSHKGGGVISEGGVQYMTAGKGILHIETPPEKLVMQGGLFHGVQLWINLPKRKKLVNPRYQNIEKTDIKLYTNQNSDSLIRLLSGKYFNQKGSGETHTELAIMHVSITPSGMVNLSWPKNYNMLVYVLSGYGETSDTTISEGELLVKGKGDTVYLKNTSKAMLEVMVLGGELIGEKVVAYGPFVMNEEREIKEALEEYSKGKLGVIPPDAVMPYHLKT